VSDPLLESVGTAGPIGGTVQPAALLAALQAFEQGELSAHAIERLYHDAVRSTHLLHANLGVDPLSKQHAQNSRMAQILERSLNEIYLFDQASLRFVYANTGALSNLGYDLAGLMALTAIDLLPEYNRTAFDRLVEPLLDGTTELLIFETILRREDGSVYNVQVHLQLDKDKNEPLFMALVLDITERKRAERVIWRQANFDALTHLPNRSMLQDRLTQEMLRADRSGNKIALLFIDIDKFKEVNDTLGHDMGDKLLVAAAQRIRECVRASDTVARMGGDEFVVLLAQLPDSMLASGLAQGMLDALRLPFDLDGQQVVVSGSIGVTLYPDDARDGDGLLKNADQAMYVSKARGRNQYSYFTRELEVSAQRRMALIGQMRHALKLGQFALYFQPIIDMRTRRICKAEALIRWQHPELGLVSPAEFIPLAEDSGLINTIGDWVFGEAVRWAKRWREEWIPDFQISINKSPAQFTFNRTDAQNWARHLDRMGLPGNSVIMEITEGMLVDPNSNVSETLLACRDAGIQVAIDDFGTGYSALSYLKRFDIDYLKIDRSFTRNVAVGASDLALSEAIIAMAHALDLQVVAEGVETEAQFDLLARAGCHFAQGYLLSHPVPPDEFEALIAGQGC
jgi:diguanylate cyclase (GGDEF)-like protein/PAS domain S-box-containing protein